MLLTEQALVGLRLRGQQVQAAVTVFGDEVRRRSDAGLGAVDGRALLTALYDLPVGLPIPLGSLDAYALRVLHAAPPGVVDIGIGENPASAVRRLVPATRVELVLVHGPDGIPPREWDSAVRDASQFAPFCARGVVVSKSTESEHGDKPASPDHVPDPQPHPDLDLLLLKARFYGVGVATQSPRGLRWLLEPAPYRPQRHSPAQWLFHEQAWRQLGPDWS
ncbi:hypothetical protein [Streptomyces yerevanensis]|uniref:hypothetical protein n=1 Tax=Streptomyces yerevanensis TaxID=66378 RepID=UPI0005262D0F|nr:hypothetical protein [Streptomyces yerevanensis]